MSSDPVTVRARLKVRLQRLLRVRDEVIAQGDAVPPELDDELHRVVTVLNALGGDDP